MSEAAASASRKSSSGLLGLGIFLIGEYAVAILCFTQQIATTHDSALGLLIGGTMVPTHMAGQQVAAFIAGNQDKYNKIAYTIAFVTQIIFLSTLMPHSPIHNKVLRRICAFVFFILEVTSDLWYASATGTTLTGAFTWIFNLGGGGWLVTLSYIVAMSAGSTLVLIDALHKTEILARGILHNSHE